MTEPSVKKLNLPGHFYVTVDCFQDFVEISVQSKQFQASTHIDLKESEDLLAEIGDAVGQCVHYLNTVANVPEPDMSVPN